MLLPTAGGDNQHGALAGQGAFAVAISPTPVTVLADAIGKSVGKHPVYPAFEDRGHGEPPERELQDQNVGPAQFRDLNFDIVRQRVIFEGVLGGRARGQARPWRQGWEIGAIYC